MRKVISIIDDDSMMLQFLGRILQSEHVNVQLFTSPKKFVSTVNVNIPDVVISDLLMPEMDGIEVLRHVQTLEPSLPFVMLTTEAKIGTAIQAMKEGVVDYIIKPIDIEEFRLRIERAYEIGKLRENVQANISQQKKIYSIEAIAGESKTARKLRELAVVSTCSEWHPLWLVGEKGVGKMFFSKVIHYNAPTAAETFHIIDCDKLSDQEFEHLVFGYALPEKDENFYHRGLAEQTHEGTLVLENPEYLNARNQELLCRLITRGMITPAGTALNVPVSIRLICVSTSEERYIAHLDAFNKEFLGCFRDNVHILQPLRKRKEDILPLAEYILSTMADDIGLCYRLTDEAKEKLEKYNWYGNIDELTLTLKRAVLLCQEQEIGVRDLIMGYSVWTTSESDTYFAIPQGMTMKELQGEYVRQTLEFYQGNLEKAAKSLGVSRKTLWEIRKKYNLP